MHRRVGEVARLYLSRRTAVSAIVVIVGAAVLTWGGRLAWDTYDTWGTPACSWPLQVRGTASLAQAGLVRCYLRALASRDTTGLMAVAADIPPVRITSADLAYSADARAGLATATFAPNPEDATSAFVIITYAAGVRENASMMNMVAMGGPSGWRMNIGTTVNLDSGPSPAASRQGVAGLGNLITPAYT
jgi:hypothetical protein